MQLENSATTRLDRPEMGCHRLRSFEGKQHKLRDLSEAHSEAIAFRQKMRRARQVGLIAECNQTRKKLGEDTYDYLVF
jgi:hypothetical protein